MGVAAGSGVGVGVGLSVGVGEGVAVGVAVGVGVAVDAGVGLSVGSGVPVGVGVGVGASVGVAVGVGASVGVGVGVGVAGGVGVGAAVGNATITDIPPENCDVNDADVPPNALKRRSPAAASTPRRYRLRGPGQRTDAAVASPLLAVRRNPRATAQISPTIRNVPVPTRSRKNPRG